MELLSLKMSENCPFDNTALQAYNKHLESDVRCFCNDCCKEPKIIKVYSYFGDFLIKKQVVDTLPNAEKLHNAATKKHIRFPKYTNQKALSVGYNAFLIFLASFVRTRQDDSLELAVDEFLDMKQNKKYKLYFNRYSQKPMFLGDWLNRFGLGIGSRVVSQSGTPKQVQGEKSIGVDSLPVQCVGSGNIVFRGCQQQVPLNRFQEPQAESDMESLLQQLSTTCHELTTKVETLNSELAAVKKANTEGVVEFYIMIKTMTERIIALEGKEKV